MIYIQLHDFKEALVGNRIVNQVQILDEMICVSFHATAFGKGMDPSVLSQGK